MVFGLDEAELRNVLCMLGKAIKFSLLNGLNLHVPIGGKFAELYVASELWKHKPKLGQQRHVVVGVKHPASCDIVLEKTKKKVEVKWSALHHSGNDPFAKRDANIPFWGWGFSTGKQFLDKKFDYCILFAARKDEAYPQHILVIKCEEMTKDSLGGLRSSALYSKGSFYIEYSHNREFYYRRRWYPKGPSPLEEDIFKNRDKYEERWFELKEKGMLQ